MTYGNTDTHVPKYVAEKNEQDAKIKGFMLGLIIGAVLSYLFTLVK